MKPVLSKAEGLVRCAIYTRKSSDEGLDQGFNSLDAQREACAAYIKSQASEGWAALPDLYDDGGISGGTLERPALKRLLADVAAGKVDVIVVYKVDRLSRSLFDFAKLVELLEAGSCSFVSITQPISTTTSMGRLTLNMLLSFAQFEREVTAERIRDKIAASKAKGMWMGGIPPLGYKGEGRSLAPVDEHAALVRDIFALYLELGNVRLLEQRLLRDGMHAPLRLMSRGLKVGGVPLSRGQLYKMLGNRIYLGEIAHRDQVYQGLHPAIVGRDVFDAVQARLTANAQGSADRVRAAQPSLLAGRIVDGTGAPLLSSHATRTTASGEIKRYRYYVSRDLQAGDSTDGLRLPAREIETAVVERLLAAFSDPLTLVSMASLQLTPEAWAKLDARAIGVTAGLRDKPRPIVEALVSEVSIEEERVTLTLSAPALAAQLGGRAPDGTVPITLALAGAIRRSGRVLRLIQGGKVSAEPETSLPRLLAQARAYWAELRKGVLNVGELAAREEVSASYLTRVLRLAFLSPTIVEAVLSGKSMPGLRGQLIGADALPCSWVEQQGGTPVSVEGPQGPTGESHSAGGHCRPRTARSRRGISAY